MDSCPTVDEDVVSTKERRGDEVDVLQNLVFSCFLHLMGIHIYVDLECCRKQDAIASSRFPRIWAATKAAYLERKTMWLEEFTVRTFSGKA